LVRRYKEMASSRKGRTAKCGGKKTELTRLFHLQGVGNTTPSNLRLTWMGERGRENAAVGEQKKKRKGLSDKKNNRGIKSSRSWNWGIDVAASRPRHSNGR